jgi:hypothetical protein
MEAEGRFKPPPKLLHADNCAEIPCVFSDPLGCTARYSLGKRDEWIQHSYSHFGGTGDTPKDSICIFCDVFKSTVDWTARMNHIHEHYASQTDSTPRPDYAVVEFLWSRKLISEEERNKQLALSERPTCDGIVSHGGGLEHMRIINERTLWKRHDLRREKRMTGGPQQRRPHGGVVVRDH